MRVVRYGTPAWRRYRDGLPRTSAPRPAVERAVAAIVRAVRRDGDAALVRLTARFDGVRLRPRELRVSADRIRALARRAEPAVVAALRSMAGRIEAYHRRQRDRGFRLRLRDGSRLEEQVRPLDSVGLYVPGGAGAYPSSVLMSAIPARVAGVERIQVVTPPRTLEASPAVAAALVLVGLERAVYRVGGAQAVAALAFGTATVPAVAKVVGPGNAFVAAAKRQVRGVVEVDQEAGPSEVVVVADESADAEWVAADLLAQAEHGSGDETAVLVTPSAVLAAEVRRAVAAGLAPRIVAGAVFVGRWAPVAVGDYGIGPNHVLPTGGAARRSSPLSVRDFQRRQSVVRMTSAGLRRVADGMARVAAAEGFRGHARSLLVRREG